MNNRLTQIAVTSVLAAVLSTAANATHTPPGSTIVNYSGSIPFDSNVNGSINSGGQDGYDFYCIGVTAGQTVSLNASSTNGLFPNLILLSSLAAAGAAYSTIAGSTVADVDNSSSPNVNLAFTPLTAGNYTVVVSTFTGQSGTYSLSGGGFTPINAACPASVIPSPVVANVAVPATDSMTLGALVIALAALGMLLVRRRRG